MKEKTDLLLFINQRQTLSQSLQYSMKILEMNSLDLLEHVENKLEENPFLIREYNHINHSELIENLASRCQLKDEIREQISFLHLSNIENEAAWALIHNIGENKYLDNELLNDISKEKNIDWFELLKVINKLKKTSFGWLFTFNLQDKLKVFLENSGQYNNNYMKLIQNIDLVFSQNWLTLKKRCNIDDQELFKMLSGMKGAFLYTDYNSYENHSLARIDLVMEENLKNEFEIATNDESIPPIHFDAALCAESSKKCRSPSDKKYIEENSKFAKLLIKSLNYRSSTLLKVSREIISRQRNFFSGYDSYLIPISVKSMANILFLHDSTIHRAISNKMISTPRGIFELKSLLPRKIKSTVNKVSDHFIKEYMKKLIDDEPKNSPYSDCNIASCLNSLGVNISRRAVAKYRATLDIPKYTERIKTHRILEAVSKQDFSRIF